MLARRARCNAITCRGLAIRNCWPARLTTHPHVIFHYFTSGAGLRLRRGPWVAKLMVVSSAGIVRVDACTCIDCACHRRCIRASRRPHAVNNTRTCTACTQQLTVRDPRHLSTVPQLATSSRHSTTTLRPTLDSLGIYRGCDGRYFCCHPLVDRLGSGPRLVGWLAHGNLYNSYYTDFRG